MNLTAQLIEQILELVNEGYSVVVKQDKLQTLSELQQNKLFDQHNKMITELTDRQKRIISESHKNL